MKNIPSDGARNDEASRRRVAADAAPGQGPDRPRLRRADRHTGAGRGGGLLARAFHPGLPGRLRRDAGPVPDRTAGEARQGSAFAGRHGHVRLPGRSRRAGQAGRRVHPAAHPAHRVSSAGQERRGELGGPAGEVGPGRAVVRSAPAAVKRHAERGRVQRPFGMKKGCGGSGARGRTVRLWFSRDGFRTGPRGGPE